LAPSSEGLHTCAGVPSAMLAAPGGLPARGATIVDEASVPKEELPPPAGGGNPMRCSACGAANPDEARFCAGCGVRLAPPSSCPGCGMSVRPEHRFCNACGTPLTAPSPSSATVAPPARPAEAAPGERRVAT